MDLQLPVQSMPITTRVARLNPVHAEVYSIYYFVIKFVYDLRQVGGFLRFLPLKVVLNTINLYALMTTNALAGYHCQEC